jgi:NitT/TauT family transport system permease protein
MASRALKGRSLHPAALGALSVFGVLAVVEALLRLGVLNPYIIPLPSAVAASIPRIVLEEDLPHRLIVSGSEALAASFLVSLVGMAVGVLLYEVKVLRLATETWVAAITAAPIVLAYPLFLVIFGRSSATIIAMAFVSGVGPVILKTLEGLRGVRAVLLDVGRSYKLSQSQQFWKILLPAALPTIFVGIRLGLIFALINLIGVEFLINFGGLGQLINDLAERYDMPGTYAAITFVVLISVVIFVALERIERLVRAAA